MTRENKSLCSCRHLTNVTLFSFLPKAARVGANEVAAGEGFGMCRKGSQGPRGRGGHRVMHPGVACNADGGGGGGGGAGGEAGTGY